MDRRLEPTGSWFERWTFALRAVTQHSPVLNTVCFNCAVVGFCRRVWFVTFCYHFVTVPFYMIWLCATFVPRLRTYDFPFSISIAAGSYSCWLRVGLPHFPVYAGLLRWWVFAVRYTTVWLVLGLIRFTGFWCLHVATPPRVSPHAGLRFLPAGRRSHV